MIYAAAAGCSHTAGTGINVDKCYVSILEKHYNMSIMNLGIPSGSCNDVLLSIVSVVKKDIKPKFIIAQWPNPFRRTAWIAGNQRLQNINSCDESFKILLRNGEENFYEPWMQSVEIANLLATQAEIPMINIMFDSLDKKYIDRLTSQQINLHIDEKIPGKTWHFDSAADDKLHHSPWCHQQWANRLIGLIDEYTAR